MTLRLLGSRFTEVSGQAAGSGRDGNKSFFGVITRQKQDLFQDFSQLVSIPDN